MTTTQTPPANGSRAAPKEEPTHKKVLGILEGRKDEIAKMAGKVLSLDRLFRLSVNAISKTPKLMECTPMSLVQSVITCAEWQLEPNTASAHAYLVPRNNKVKDAKGNERKEMQASAMLGYRGMLELFRRSGLGDQIWADVVYEGQPFRWLKRTSEAGLFVFDFEHDQSDPVGETTNIIASYAVAVFGNNRIQGTKLERWEIEKIRRAS